MSERWMRHGACVPLWDPETDLWFPERMTSDAVDHAKAVCAGCPVRTDCLAYARQERIDHGIWGGMTPDERVGRCVKTPRNPLIDHGTYNGYMAHRRRGEQACPECKAANAQRNRDYLASRRHA